MLFVVTTMGENIMIVNREVIKSEIDLVDTQYLDTLYRIVKSLQMQITREPQSGLMANLKTVKISGPKDFAENIDAYLSGEKHA